MEISEEVKAKLGKAGADVCMAMAVSSCLHSDNKFSPDSVKDYEAVETLILELMSEGDPFMATFIKVTHRMMIRGMKIKDCKSFQWSTKDELEKTQQEDIDTFGKYLSSNVIHYIKFPDKKIRDKLSRAFSRLKDINHGH